MFDGSALPFTENLKRTKEIIRIAHSLGITVEGELGYSSCFDQNINVTNMYTEMAVDFVEKTNIDALAVGVSNSYGKCPGNLHLNFNRVAELNNALAVPLVMNGGSKLTKEEYHSSISAGIAKVNIATDMSLAAMEKLKAELAKSPQRCQRFSEKIYAVF